MLVPVFCENQTQLLPAEFYYCLPKYCPECEYPMEMSETLTQLHCSNPKCPSKVAQRLVAIANSLGVKNLGDARAQKFVNALGLTNPLLIFAYEPDEDGQMAPDISLDVSRDIASQFQSRKKFTLAEYIRIANLPFIQSSAFSLFEGYDDLGEAYKAIESGGVEYIRDRLSIKENGEDTISVRALKVYESLMTFKDDLFQTIDCVEIMPINLPEMTTIRAVCSSEVGEGFRTKAEFYATCNNLYKNIHIEFGNSVTKKTDYLIWAGADGGTFSVTNKVAKARRYQEAGSSIKIVSALAFLGILEHMAGGMPEY